MNGTKGLKGCVVPGKTGSSVSMKYKMCMLPASVVKEKKQEKKTLKRQMEAFSFVECHQAGNIKQLKDFSLKDSIIRSVCMVKMSLTKIWLCFKQWLIKTEKLTKCSGEKG